MFYIEKLYNNNYAVIKLYDDGNRESWYYTNDYNDALEYCHYLNGGTTREWFAGKYRIWEWKLVEWCA